MQRPDYSHSGSALYGRPQRSGSRSASGTLCTTVSATPTLTHRTLLRPVCPRRGFSILDVLVTLTVIGVLIAFLSPSISLATKGAGARSLILAGVGAVLSVIFLFKALAASDRGRREGMMAVTGAVIAASVASYAMYGPYSIAVGQCPALDTVQSIMRTSDLSFAEAKLRVSPEDAALAEAVFRDLSGRVLASLNWSSAAILGVVSLYWGFAAASSRTYEAGLARAMRSRIFCLRSCLNLVAGISIIAAKVVLAEAATGGTPFPKAIDPWVRSLLNSPLLNDSAVVHSLLNAEADIHAWLGRVTGVSVFELALVCQAFCYYLMDRWVDLTPVPEIEPIQKRSWYVSAIICAFAASSAFAATLVVRKIAYICLYFPGGLHLTV